MNDRFLRACRRQPVDCTPVWFMRQAGRYLPEYRRLRERYSLMDLCGDPELAAEVTLMPLRRFAVDAVIIFADLMTPLEAMGVRFEVQEGIGPIVPTPIRCGEDVTCLRVPEVDEIAPATVQAIRLVKREINGVPLIGFAGAPFTLASYLLEGGPSRDFAQTKRFMLSEPQAWHTLMEKLTETVIRYLTAQTQAGADAVQIFDSWVGCLCPDDYRAFVLPHMERLFAATAVLNVPRIHFGTGTATLLSLMKQAGGEVIGLDWRIPLDEAWRTLNFEVAVQGNLDPATLLVDSFEVIAQRTHDILRRAGGRAGHIFNLGHGVLPQTNPDYVARLVDLVHETTAKK
ncbi:Uroporphyrinogen decarboxylase [bacterium HR17]|jgi:uroporphyrinogen decarboxylase|uniref:Uroporphyrinogen decarboxylase n=1 Tax=Candidatus Fervidibacter japonicus TaxID=2035412 RepID=A0A2H5X9Z9_9BACT|nr:Uroporphyrinogen decarboxylase [bacterium HR17]